ncbi:MAG: hypothetical protein CMF62_04055 [Magnetococcales bacterium]|nr:hypothetical protein [Magnetococcales bacterium]|tara:strand:+ start:4884 stop:5228 length:345 start_codon:yes stop_codon:yes gene_type:complete
MENKYSYFDNAKIDKNLEHDIYDLSDPRDDLKNHKDDLKNNKDDKNHKEELINKDIFDSILDNFEEHTKNTNNKKVVKEQKFEFKPCTKPKKKKSKGKFKPKLKMDDDPYADFL